MSRAKAEGSRGPRGQVGRASRSPGQLWQVPTFFLGLLAFIAAFVTAPSRRDNTAAAFQTELANLRRGLEPDQEKPAVLVAQAENLLARLPQFPRKAGEIHFLAGSAYFRQAGQCTPDVLESNQRKAVSHLEDALALGVAAGDLMPLQYRLGFTLYRQGKDQKRAIELMAASVDKGADQPAQGYGLLVQAYLALPKPNLDAALDKNLKQLELTDVRNVEEMALARLKRGELLLGKEDRAEAFKELKRIGKGAPRELRLKARLLQTKICEEEGHWNAAVELWKELLPDAQAIQGGKARILYALGLAYKRSEPPQVEAARASWQEAFELGGEEAGAAGMRLGDILLDGRQPDIEGALKIWTKVFENVRTPNDYKIEALEITQARDIFDHACLFLLENRQYQASRSVAELFKKIDHAGVADERIAQAAEGLAWELQNEAKRLAPAELAGKLEEVRVQFHRAAVAFEEAAGARSEESQAAVYWRSAQCYLAAKDFPSAAPVLNKFVKLEKNESRLAEGWLALAETFQALGHKENAHGAYFKCIEIPATPFASRARYQLAMEEMANRNYSRALAILQQNLNAHGPSEDRSAHEKSIFKYAELHYLSEEYDKAAFYYKEACQLYRVNPGVLAARDQLADCYKKLADQAERKMKTAKDETTRTHFQNERRSWLEQGAVTYEALADELEHKQRQNPLAPKEINLLRKALFGTADMRFDMNDFSEALRRFESIQERYRKQVEGLIACQRIWKCVGVMVDTVDQTRKVRAATEKALEKFRTDLEAMPDDSEAFRGGGGVYTKENWRTWLQWVEGQLKTSTSPLLSGN